MPHGQHGPPLSDGELLNDLHFTHTSLLNAKPASKGWIHYDQVRYRRNEMFLLFWRLQPCIFWRVVPWNAVCHKFSPRHNNDRTQVNTSNLRGQIWGCHEVVWWSLANCWSQSLHEIKYSSPGWSAQESSLEELTSKMFHRVQILDFSKATL